MAAALAARHVAEILGVHPDTVFKLAREGRIPGPIDPTLSGRLWRWSPQQIDRYVAGEWTPEAAA